MVYLIGASTSCPGYAAGYEVDSVPLWRDEATTANWGWLMAESGVWIPRVYDGDQLIVQAADGHDVNSHLLPAMQSWLQFYVSALAFRLLGVSTFSARFPFALIGAFRERKTNRTSCT